MPHIDDIRRLWSEGRDVTEIAHVTGHDRKTVRKYLQITLGELASQACDPSVIRELARALERETDSMEPDEAGNDEGYDSL